MSATSAASAKSAKSNAGQITALWPKFSCLVKVDPSQDQKKPSYPEEILGQEEEVSSSTNLT